MRGLFSIHSVIRLAQECIEMGKQERPELKQLKYYYERIQEKYGFVTKEETDQFIYEKMYGNIPSKPSQYLKIRYWRTGRYTPGNREELKMFGEALELTKEEQEWLVQSYYDRCLVVYNNHIDHADKKKILEEITVKYIENVPEEQLRYLNISREKAQHYLRHLYFTDAFHYVYASDETNRDILAKHITSTRYDSEFKRQMHLIGEIPRKAMIRHLLILNMPELTLESLNEQLICLGYLPLCGKHTIVSGEHLDYLIIELLKLYEKSRKTRNSEKSHNWFREACRTLDRFFREAEKPHLRFMYFKGLDFIER